jgi:hypothetical protein
MPKQGAAVNSRQLTIALGEEQPAMAPSLPSPAVTRLAGDEVIASAAHIKAAFKAGQLSREEAIRQLQALGFSKTNSERHRF